jgi:hypothetical protein
MGGMEANNYRTVVLVVEVPAARLALSDMAAEEMATGSSKPRL